MTAFFDADSDRVSMKLELLPKRVVIVGELEVKSTSGMIATQCFSQKGHLVPVLKWPSCTIFPPEVNDHQSGKC